MDRANKILAMVLGIGILVWFLFIRRKPSSKTGVVAPQPSPGASPSNPGGPNPLPYAPVNLGGPQSNTTNQLQNIAQTVTNQIVPVPLVTAPIVKTEVNAVENIIHGEGSAVDIAGNVATVAFFPVGVTVAFVNAIGDALGLSGKPLGQVQFILLNRLSSPPYPDRNNVQYGNPMYVIDVNGYRHQIMDPPGVNAAGYSWREIIAADASLVDSFPDGTPITSAGAPNSHGFQPLLRPAKAEDIRRIFGQNSMFTMSNDPTVHGPWEVSPPPPPPPPSGLFDPNNPSTWQYATPEQLNDLMAQLGPIQV